MMPQCQATVARKVVVEVPHFRFGPWQATVAAVAARGGDPDLTTFAGRLAHVLERDGVSNRELGRRLAGPSASEKQAEHQRTGVLRWLRENGERVEPTPESARKVERVLGLEDGYLVSVLQPRPRGRPAALSRAQEISALREELEELRRAGAAAAERYDAALRGLEAQAAEREREVRDLALLVAGLDARVERLEGGASQKRGSSA